MMINIFIRSSGRDNASLDDYPYLLKKSVNLITFVSAIIKSPVMPIRPFVP